MLEINGYQLRNLQEQVEKNKNDIITIINEQGTLNQFGIKVVGQIDIINNLPTVEDYKESNPNWEYGDAYAVGVMAPYSLYILTRANGTHPDDYWFNIGQFPLQGAQGKDGAAATVEVGSTVTLIEGSPARVENIGDKVNAKLNFYIPRGEKGSTPTITIGTVESTTGNPEVTNSGTDTGAIFNFKFPKGEKGDKGDTGATGESFRIIATLDNINQLPTPTEAIRSNAYLIPDDENENHLWVITGDTALLWTDAGQIQGVKGETGPQGPAGTPGTNGTNGAAATISIGSVATLQPNASATVTNVGTSNNAILNFGIPKGVDGTTGVFTHDIYLTMNINQIYRPSLAKMCFSVTSKSKTPVTTLAQLMSLLQVETSGYGTRHIPASGWAYFPYDGNYLCSVDWLRASITNVGFIYNFIGKNAVLTDNEVTSTTYAPEIAFNSEGRIYEFNEATITSITIQDTVNPK